MGLYGVLHVGGVEFRVLLMQLLCCSGGSLEGLGSWCFGYNISQNPMIVTIEGLGVSILQNFKNAC